MDGDPGARPAARWWHLATAVVVGATLLLQLVLALAGGPESVLTRLLRLVSYFTIQGSVLLFAGLVLLVREPTRNGPRWRVTRLAGVVAMTVTAAIYVVVLRPTVRLEGWSLAAEVGLHDVGPALALVGWVAFGPRRRVDARTVLWTLLWPVAWVGWTLAHGALSGWYPYPFIDVRAIGYAHALVDAAFVTLLLFACFAAAGWADSRLAAWEQARLQAHPGWGPSGRLIP